MFGNHILFDEEASNELFWGNEPSSRKIPRPKTNTNVSILPIFLKNINQFQKL
jgi:hypothetical protein